MDVAFDIRHIRYDVSHQIRVLLSGHDIHWFFPPCRFDFLTNTFSHERSILLSECLTTSVVHNSVGAIEGDLVGDCVGDKLGDLVGDFVGDLVGDLVGDTVGPSVGNRVG
jgi:hypothetical protein